MAITLVQLPIAMPPVVAGLGLLLAFGRRGLLEGRWWALASRFLSPRWRRSWRRCLSPHPFHLHLHSMFRRRSPYDLRRPPASTAQVPRSISGWWCCLSSWNGLASGLSLKLGARPQRVSRDHLFAGACRGAPVLCRCWSSALEIDLSAAALWSAAILVSLAGLALGYGALVHPARWGRPAISLTGVATLSPSEQRSRYHTPRWRRPCQSASSAGRRAAKCDAQVGLGCPYTEQYQR